MPLFSFASHLIWSYSFSFLLKRFFVGMCVQTAIKHGSCCRFPALGNCESILNSRFHQNENDEEIYWFSRLYAFVYNAAENLSGKRNSIEYTNKCQRQLRTETHKKQVTMTKTTAANKSRSSTGKWNNKKVYKKCHLLSTLSLHILGVLLVAVASLAIQMSMTVSDLQTAFMMLRCKILWWRRWFMLGCWSEIHFQDWEDRPPLVTVPNF